MKSPVSENFPFKPKNWPFFYGYAIVLWAAFGLMLSAPGQTIGVSVFTDHLISALGISRLQLSTAYALGTIGSAVIIRMTGKLLDNIGTRLVATVAVFSLGGALLFMSQVDRIASVVTKLPGFPQSTLIPMIIVIIGFLFLRFFGQGILALSSRTMLMRWFVSLRGRMNALMGIVSGLTFNAAPLMFELLIQKNGWRGAWQLLGLLFITVFSIIVFIFFRNRPESCGLIPDGKKFHFKHADSIEEKNWTLKEAKRTRVFWILNFGTAMFSLYITAFTFHVVSIFKTSGFERQEAISIFLPASVISIILSLVAGWLADRPYFRNRMHLFLTALLAGVLLSSAGVFLIKTPPGLLMIIVGNGIGSGMFGTVTSVAWPRYFGKQHLGEIAGYNMSYLVFFSAIGPPLFGFAYNQQGSYTIALLACSIFLVILLGVSFVAAKPQKMISHKVSN